MQPWVLAWVFLLSGVHQEVLSVGDSTLQLALSSGTSIESALLVDSSPVPSAASGVIFTQYTALFALTEEDVAKLAASPITFVRVNRGADQFRGYDASSAKKSKWKKYPEQVQCLLDAVAGA